MPTTIDPTTTAAASVEANPQGGEPMRLGIVCHSCALVLANDDDSHLSDDEAEDVRATLGAIRRDEAATLYVENIDDTDSFRCSVCGDDEFGPAYALLGWRG